MIDDGETLSHLTTQRYFQHPSLPDPKTHVTLTVFAFFLATVGLLVFNFEYKYKLNSMKRFFMREFASMRVEKVRVNKDTAFFSYNGVGR